tara:strand:+ start:52 stop:285 length:234 start_codon:yes stop_codon:yes gene_type:complete
MNRFIELLERKIDGCDALGGLEREKAVYQSVLKDYKKQLTLTDVGCSFCEEIPKKSFYLGQTCEQCNKPFRAVKTKQ